MSVDFAAVLEAIAKYGPKWGVVVVVSLFFISVIVFLLRVLLDEDRSAIWRARFFRVLFKVSGTRRAEKKYIGNDVVGRLNLARRSMPFGEEYLPKAIKVEWFDGSAGESQRMLGNKIFVQLDSAEAQEKNIVLLARALVSQTSLVGIRHFLTAALEVSMDLRLIKNLLVEIKDNRTLDWFFRNDYQPSINESPQVSEWSATLAPIDDRGLFTRLLLVELSSFAKRVMGTPASMHLFNEISSLLHFVRDLATKLPREKPRLSYISRHIKVGVVLAGVTEKILKGANPYLDAVAGHLRGGADSIYVVEIDKLYLKRNEPETYNRVIKLLNDLLQRIEREFPLKRNFSIPYSFISYRGDKQKGKISHYIRESA